MHEEATFEDFFLCDINEIDIFDSVLNVLDGQRENYGYGKGKDRKDVEEKKGRTFLFEGLIIWKEGLETRDDEVGKRKQNI